MRSFITCFLLLSFLLMPLTAMAVKPDPEILKVSEPLIEKALEAFNAQDATAFYENWATSMQAIATPQAFGALYAGMYWPKYGKFVSRELVEERCSLMNDSPVGLLVYKCKFEKQDVVFLSVNLMKEEETWKLMQLQMGDQ